MPSLRQAWNANTGHPWHRVSTPTTSRWGANELPDRTSAPGIPSFNNDNQQPQLDPAYELDCLRKTLAPALLRAAEVRSHEVGLGADQVLISWGVIDEDAYLQRLAFHSGMAFETFANVGREDCPLLDRHFPHAAEHGFLPLRQAGRLIWVVAPRGLAARRLSRLAAIYPSLTSRVRLTSVRHLNQFLTQEAGEPLAEFASEGLTRQLPAMSAAPVVSIRPQWRRRLQRILRACALAAPMVVPTSMAVDLWSGVLAVWFLAFIGLRLAGSFVPQRNLSKLRRLKDLELPVYTLIVALYREASSVAPLMRSINALDYPREKLNVILAIEPSDLETRAAIARLGPMPHVQVLVAPAAGPRTKPKALNYALPFARGSFTAVFDAEDRPEPNQLRAALDAFRVHGNAVACAQASLCIENPSDSWLSRMFMTEYAGQFDVFLPGLATLGMPLPLGGSSNHFRTAILRKVGAWDAYNVTEDADLGLRLARFGYRSVMFASTTYEEAPSRFAGWLRQRSRWIKGWMTTWSVHMRSPRRLWREAGPRGFLMLNIFIGGNVFTALAYPILLAETLACLTSLVLDQPTPFFTGDLTPLHLTAIAAGYVTTLVIGTMGLARRGRLRSGWVLLAIPVYWGCLSIAAWRALYQLLTEPYRWEKTEHGVARQPPSPRWSSANLPPVRNLFGLRDSA